MSHLRGTRLAVTLTAIVLCVHLPTSLVAATASNRMRVGGAVGLRADPWPLGTYEANDQLPQSCPDGMDCSGFAVTGCEQVSQDGIGFIAMGAPTGAPRGVIIFFSGSTGMTWWGEENPDIGAYFDSLRSDGYATLLIAWADNWQIALANEPSGAARLACRAATAIDWAHDNIYVQMGVSPGPGECGFCVTGNSGGASEVSYAISFYRLADIIDGAIPTSGPVHGAITKGCIRSDPVPSKFWYPDWAAGFIDYSYGFIDMPELGPCINQDFSWVTRWRADSVTTGGSSYSYPDTRVVFLIGGRDSTPAPAHARTFFNKLRSVGGTLSVAWTVIRAMPHAISSSPEGLAELKATIEWTADP